MSEIITNPKLPPRECYIEVEINGVRQYQKIETEQDKQIAVLEAQNADLSATVKKRCGKRVDNGGTIHGNYGASL